MLNLGSNQEHEKVRPQWDIILYLLDGQKLRNIGEAAN